MYTTVSTADNHSMTKIFSENTTMHSKYVGYKKSLSRALYVDKGTS